MTRLAEHRTIPIMRGLAIVSRPLEKDFICRDAITWAEAALRERPNYLAAIRELAAASALAGRLPEAQKAMAHLREIDPTMRVSNVKDWVPFRRPDDLKRLQEGLRMAGLPE